MQLIEAHFPRNNILAKIFNKNTVKLSYSCMENLKRIIDSNNKRGLTTINKTPNVAAKTCNCRQPASCPLKGECTTECVIYQATVKTDKNTESYVGLTENSFKYRYANHKSSFNNTRTRNATELSKYIWRLKETNTDYTISWRIIKRARAYSNTTKKCNLCIWENFFIIYRPEMSSLNKRTELVNSCRHANKFLLSNA